MSLALDELLEALHVTVDAVLEHAELVCDSFDEAVRVHLSPRTATLTVAPGLGYALQLLAGRASLPFLPLIRRPTLILAGDADPIVPVINAKTMYRLTPRSTLHIYPCGRLGPVTVPGSTWRRVPAAGPFTSTAGIFFTTTVV